MREREHGRAWKSAGRVQGGESRASKGGQTLGEDRERMGECARVRCERAPRTVIRPRQYGRFQSELQRLLIPIGCVTDQSCAQFTMEQDLIRFSTSVKRLLALKRQASVKGNDESSPKADE